MALLLGTQSPSQPVIVYVDASYDPSGRSGMAVLIQWADGSKTRYTVSDVHTNSTDAEITAIQEAVFRLKAANIEHAIIYTDCQGAVNKVMSPYSVLWIPREQNQAADALSRIARTTWDTKGKQAKTVYPMFQPSALSPQREPLLIESSTIPTIAKSADTRSTIREVWEKTFRDNPALPVHQFLRDLPLPQKKQFVGFLNSKVHELHIGAAGEMYYRPDDESYFQAGKKKRKQINVRLKQFSQQIAEIDRKRRDTLVGYLHNVLGPATLQTMVCLSSMVEQMPEAHRLLWKEFTNRQQHLLCTAMVNGFIVDGEYLLPDKTVLAKEVLTQFAHNVGAMAPKRFMKWTTYLAKVMRPWQGETDLQVVQIVAVVNKQAQAVTKWMPLSAVQAKQHEMLQKEARQEKREADQALRIEQLQAIHEAVTRTSVTRSAFRLPLLPEIKGLSAKELVHLVTKIEAIRLIAHSRDDLEEAIRCGVFHTYPLGPRVFLLAHEIKDAQQHPERWNPVLDQKILVRVSEVKALIGMNDASFARILRDEHVKIVEEKHHGYYSYTIDMLNRGDALRLIWKYTKQGPNRPAIP